MPQNEPKLGSGLISWTRIALAVVGIFVTTTLTVAHQTGVELPCGFHQCGCTVVSGSALSAPFGVPIAAFGLIPFLAVALVPAFQQAFGDSHAPALERAALRLVAAGAIVSLILISYAVFVLRATCSWCTASAVLMSLLFGILSKEGTKVVSNRSWLLTGTSIALILAASAGGFAFSFGQARLAYNELSGTVEKPEVVQRLLDNNHYWGDPGAPITIVVFTDVNCSVCRRLHPWLVSLPSQYPNVKVAYRHFPLNNGVSYQAAILLEWAGARSKFWQLFDAIQAAKPVSTDDLVGCAAKTGLDPAQAQAIITESNGQEKYRRMVIEDRTLGLLAGVKGTPFSVVIRKGHEARWFRGSAIRNFLPQIAGGQQ